MFREDASRFVWPALALCCVVLVSSFAFGADVDRQLSGHYLHKEFVLRNFYSGNHLVYDSAGNTAGSSRSGDWTSDGILEINRIHLARHQLRIRATRMVAASNADGLDLVRSKDEARIEINLDRAQNTVAAIESVLSHVFLTRQDRLSDFVPDFWKPCIQVALTAATSDTYRCRFAHDLGELVGAGSYAATDPSMAVAPTSADVLLSGRGPDGRMRRPPSDVKAPRALNQQLPPFTEEARKLKFQGVVVLSLVVDSSGMPKDIRVVQPLGCGLDANAVHSVESWTFTPAEKDGQPVSAAIAIETSFHLY